MWRFATVDENGRPQVRMIDVMLVEAGKLYFCTARGKDFYRQLIRDGHVAITGMNPGFPDGAPDRRGQTAPRTAGVDRPHF